MAVCCGAAVAQQVEQVGDWKVAGSNPGSVCQSVFEQEPPLLISEGPAMSWRLVQGVPCPCPETAGISSSSNTSGYRLQKDVVVFFC